MTVKDLSNLHSDDVTLWLHVEEAAWQLVKGHNLFVTRIFPLKGSGGLAGSYDWDTGEIGISLRDRDGSRYPAWYVLDSICHESAHAKTGWTSPEHNGKFVRAFARMLVASERLGLRAKLIKGGLKP